MPTATKKYRMPPHVVEDFRRMLEIPPDEAIPSGLVLRYKRYEKVNSICSLAPITSKELLLIALSGGFLRDVEPDATEPDVEDVDIEVVEADVPPVDPEYEDGDDVDDDEDEDEEEDFSF